MKNYNLGLVSVSFREKTPEEILKEMKICGLSFIEWGSDIHAPCNDTKNIENIAILQEKYGITCSSYGTYFRLGATPLEELVTYINAAKILGTNILRVWCSNKNSEEHTKEEKNALFLECKKAAKIAEENGVTLCLECHINTYTNQKDAALDLMKNVASKNFKMYWQPSQYKTSQENIAYAKAIAPYTEHIHVFNWKGEEKFPLCEAVDIWKQFLDCFSGERTLLLEFMPDGKLETLKQETTALKEITK